MKFLTKTTSMKFQFVIQVPLIKKETFQGNMILFFTIQRLISIFSILRRQELNTKSQICPRVEHPSQEGHRMKNF